MTFDRHPAPLVRSGRGLAALGHFLVEHLSQQEGHFEALPGVEARVAVRVVTVRQRLFGYVDRAAGTLGDVLAGHLGMDAAGMGPLGAVDGEEAAHLGQDAVEGARLIAGRRLDRVAVHRIARPDHRMALTRDGADQLGQMRLDLVMAIAGDEFTISFRRTLPEACFSGTLQTRRRFVSLK